MRDAATVAELETRDRNRGLNVGDCDVKRETAVNTIDATNRAVDQWLADRKARRGWGCRWFKLGCPKA